MANEWKRLETMFVIEDENVSLQGRAEPGGEQMATPTALRCRLPRGSRTVASVGDEV